MKASTSAKPLTKYQKVNYLYLFFVGATFVVNIIVATTEYDYTFAQSLIIGANVLNLLLTIAFVVLILLPESKAGKTVQTLILIGFGYVYIATSETIRAGGEVMVALGVFLMLKYGLLEKHLIAKMGLVAAGIVGAMVTSVILYRIAPVNVALYLILAIVGIGLLWIVFEEDVRRFRSERDALFRRHVEEKPFVEFGKNTAGLAQDLKGDINLVTTLGESLRSTIRDGDAPGIDEVERILGYVTRLEHRVDMVRYVTADRGRSENELIDLNQLIESAIYIFQIRPEYGNRIRFRFVPTNEPTCLGSRARILSVVETVIQTVCSHLEPSSTGGEMPTVVIGVERSEGKTVVVVSDDGPGISGCADCDGDNCVDCLEMNGDDREWAETVSRIRVTLAELNGSIAIRSTAGTGTEIRVRL